MLRLPLASAVLATLPAALWADAPRVVADTPVMHSIVTQVMAGVGAPDLLLPPGASPHDYAMRPSDAAKLAEAEVIFWVGPGLTPWLGDPVATLGGEALSLALLDTAGWPALPLRDWEDGHAHGAGADEAHDDDHDDDHADDMHGEEAHEEAHEDEHADDHADDAHGHAHGDGTDPHAWLDPQVASAWAASIADTLAGADPDNAATYRQNAEALAAANTALITEIDGQLAPLRGRGYIVPHDAFQYFETRFAVPASGTISLSDAQTPTPGALAELRDMAQAGGIVCILTDAQTDPDWARLVAEGTDIRLVSADPEGATLDPGADLYAGLVRGLAAALADCLGDGA